MKVMIIQNKKVEETALKKRLRKLDKKLYSVWSGNDEEKSMKTQNSLELPNCLANANISLISSSDSMWFESYHVVSSISNNCSAGSSLSTIGCCLDHWCTVSCPYVPYTGSSSKINIETNTVDEEDVCESYIMHEITKKRKLTPLQLRLLEESFDEEKKLEPERKLWLAEKLGLQPSQVAVWFQNRRARYKTKQLEHDWDSLKASYTKLKADWDILFLQNQTLKNKVTFLKEKLRMQESLDTRSMGAKKLGKEGSSVKTDNTKYSGEEGLGNQYSFPELAVLGFYYDPTFSASNLRL